jgi:hypothetical protein
MQWPRLNPERLDIARTLAAFALPGTWSALPGTIPVCNLFLEAASKPNATLVRSEREALFDVELRAVSLPGSRPNPLGARWDLFARGGAEISEETRNSENVLINRSIHG